MLDYGLIIVSGIAVFAQAVLGLLVTTRPPSEERRLRYEISFIAIGFIGVAAIVWGGVRTAQTSSRIEYGVGEIEQLGAANNGTLHNVYVALSDQRKYLQERFADQDQRLRQTKAATISVPAPHAPTTHVPKPRSSSQTPSTDSTFSDLISKMQAQNAKDQVHWACVNDIEIPVSVGLYRLIAAAANDQNSWAYTRDGALLRSQYETWLGEVREFFSEHKDALPDTSDFEKIKDLDMGPTLFVIPPSGENAWHNFDDRRKALEKIQNEFSKMSCDDQGVIGKARSETSLKVE